MSQVIDMCKDSDNGERLNSASVSSLPRSSKRVREKKDSYNDAHPRNGNYPGHKTATGSAWFVVDLELSNKVEVQPHRKRRGVVRSERSEENGAAGKYTQILKGVEATVKDIGSEEADPRESHEGITVAASHPMNSDSEQTSRDDGSRNKYSHKLSTSKPLSNVSRRQGRASAWEDRLSELADYRKIHGNCNVPQRYSENTKLGEWVSTQRKLYKSHFKGKASHIIRFRIQALESLGFEWVIYDTAWENRLSELADYRKTHGHCNVPYRYREKSKLGKWVGTQRTQYRLHLEGKTSSMTTFRIQELEIMGFEWRLVCDTAWEDRLRELADYRKTHGHCNVPQNYKENRKLGTWVTKQRSHYRLYQDGKKSNMTLSRIQELECLSFEWKPSIGRRKITPKKTSLDDDATCVRERAVEPRDYMQQHSLKKTPAVDKSAAIKSTSLSNPKNPTGMSKSTLTLSRVEPQDIRRVEAGDARFDYTDLDGSPSELAAKASLCSDRQVAKSLSLDQSAAAGNCLESNTRDDAPRANQSWPARQQKSINSFSHALLVAGPPENEFLGPAKKPANSRRGADSRLETAPSEEMLRANPSVVELHRQRRNLYTHDLLLGDGSTWNGVQTTPTEPADAPLDMQQTHQDGAFHTDNVLKAVEMELIWLGEESMYCFVCPEFQFDFIYEYASPALKAKLRKLSRDDQSEKEKLRQIVRMDNWLVSRHFDFTRKDIRMNYF